MRRSPARWLAPWLLAAGTAAAQPGPVDAGSFRITGDGRLLGREQFSITRVPTGSGWAYEVRGEAAWGDRTIAWRLSADSTGSPLSARRETRERGAIVERATGQLVRGRFATLARGTRREAAREHRVGAGTAVLDPTLVHLFALLLPQLATRDSLAVLTLDGPRAGWVVRRAAPATDTIIVGGQPLPARRWPLTWDGEPVVVWTDRAGRLLAVDRARWGARRDDPPSP